MRSRPRAKTIVIAAAVLAAAVLGYWGYDTYQKKELRTAVTALLTEAGTRLREALAIEAGPPAADRQETMRRLDAYAAAVEQNLQALKRLNAAADQTLADAADDYLVTGREILRRQAAIHRYRQLLSESLQGLRDRLGADSRTGSWVRDAVRDKDRVEKDYRDYRLAAGAFGTLLESLPAAQAKIARRIGVAVPIEESLIREARNRAADDLKQATGEVEKIRKLVPVR